MDDLEIEERLASETILYTTNPGAEEVSRLKRYWDVVVISNDQIRITYKS